MKTVLKTEREINFVCMIEKRFSGTQLGEKIAYHEDYNHIDRHIDAESFHSIFPTITQKVYLTRLKP